MSSSWILAVSMDDKLQHAPGSRWNIEYFALEHGDRFYRWQSCSTSKKRLDWRNINLFVNSNNQQRFDIKRFSLACQKGCLLIGGQPFQKARQFKSTTRLNWLKTILKGCVSIVPLTTNSTLSARVSFLIFTSFLNKWKLNNTSAMNTYWHYLIVVWSYWQGFSFSKFLTFQIYLLTTLNEDTNNQNVHNAKQTTHGQRWSH